MKELLLTELQYEGLADTEADELRELLANEISHGTTRQSYAAMGEFFRVVNPAQ